MAAADAAQPRDGDTAGAQPLLFGGGDPPRVRANACL